MQALETWLSALTGADRLWMAEVFLIVLCALILGYVINKVIDRLEHQVSKTRNVWDDALLEACRRPLVWLVWVLGVNFAALVASRVAVSEWEPFIDQLNRVAVIFLFSMFLLNFINRAEKNFLNTEFRSPPADKTTAKAVGRLLRIAVVISALLIVLQVFNYSISGLLAFGGVGGIAVGFASKDLLANFFGGMMIYFDRPFKVGDWIRSPDRQVEGTVEDIGWRVTRIRTFDKRPLYVPNSVFMTISIENPSRMSHRRIYETIGIRYSDIGVMDKVVVDVKAMLVAHNEIDTKQTMIVNFNAFSASSLDFFVYSFTKTCNWIHFHRVKQDVLLKIADIVRHQGAEVAYPTSTLHVSDAVQVELTERQTVRAEAS